MTISLFYYTEQLDRSIPVSKRELYLRYLDGCKLSTGELLEVFNTILTALTGEQTNLLTVEECRWAIEIWIHDNPRQPQKGNYTDEEDSIIRKMKASNHTNQQIADKLGRTKQGIAARWSILCRSK
jgi:hypothetical protein